MEEVKRLALSRGGKQQRAAAFEAQTFKADNVKSELATLLVTLFSWGSISAISVQAIAKAASNDLLSAGKGKINEWEVLAQLGAHGTLKNNIHRDLMRKLPKATLPLTQTIVPVKCSPCKGSVVHCAFQRAPLLLPCDLWKDIWDTGNFKRFILEDASMLEGFWKEVGDHPALQHHPVKQVRNYQRRAIPLALHGDGAAVTQSIGSGSKSCLFLSFRSLMTRSNKHFLMAAIWSHITVKKNIMNTANSIFSAIAKSFLQMQNEDGKDSGGFFGVPVFSTGDLEYFNEYQGCPRWNANFPCSFCNIPKEALIDWKRVPDMNPDPWNLPRQHPSSLFRTLMSPLSIAPDWMHSKHLGIDQRFLASVIWMILHMEPQQTTLDERLDLLLHDMRDAWSQVF